MFVTSHCTKKFRQHVKLHDKEPSKQRLLNSNKLSRNADTQKTSNKILFIFCSLPCAVGFGFNELISGGNDHLYLAKHLFLNSELNRKIRLIYVSISKQHKKHIRNFGLKVLIPTKIIEK